MFSAIEPPSEPWPQVLSASPLEEEVSNLFYFEDTQVVLQASHDITNSNYPYIH
jgi:hypothetical protein